MAGNSKAIRMGQAYEEVYAELSPLERGLKYGEGLLKKFGEKLSRLGEPLAKGGGAALGVEGIAALLEKLKGFNEPAVALLKVSQQTGASVEAIGELQHAAKSAGVDVDSMTTGLGRMQKLLFEAASGSKEARGALALVGLSVSDLARLSPDKQFELIGQRIAAIKDPAVRTAAAMQLLGKGGADLIPLFARGTEWMARMRQEAIDNGRKTTEQAEAAHAFDLALDRLYGSVGRITGAMVSSLAPAVKDVADVIQPIATAIADWIRKNKELVTTATLVAAAAFAVGASLIGIGSAAAAMGTGLATAGTIAGVAVGALLSPVGLAALAVAALAANFIPLRSAAGGAVDWISAKFTELKEHFGQAWQGISDAIASGNFGLAFQIATAQGSLEWARLMLSLRTAWIGFKFSAIEVAIDLAAGIVEALASGFMKVQQLWQETQTQMLIAALETTERIKQGRMQLTDDEKFGIGVGVRMATAGPAITNKAAGVGIAAGILKGQLGTNGRREMLAAGLAGAGEIDDAKKQLDALTKKAADERGKGMNMPGTNVPFTDHLSDLATHAQTKGIGSADVRTKEGADQLLASLRASHDDAPERAARTLEQMAGVQTREAVDLRKSREALENITVFSFG